MMNYKLFPTLKDRALTNVAVAIWNKDTLKTLACWEHHSDPNLERAEINARERTAKLVLPSHLIKELQKIIKVIGLELRAWVQFHERLGNFLGTVTPMSSKFEFCWTSYGTIDRKRTAESIIEDENVDVLTRYKYACEYCLEFSIRNLWKKLDRRSRQAIKCLPQLQHLRGPVNMFLEVSLQMDRVLIFWSFVMDGEANRPTTNNRVNFPNDDDVTSYRYPFLGAVFGGNEIALKYFVQKMTPEEREICIVTAVNLLATFCTIEFARLKRTYKIYYSNALCFLLSSMNEAQQTKIFKNHGRAVLSSLLEWPWQQFFISTTEHVKENLSSNDILFILCQLLNPHYIKVCTDYNYQDIFENFWELSSPTHKKYILDGPVHRILLLSFLVGKKENIFMIMKHATPEQSLKILRNSQKLHCHLIARGDVNILKFLLWKSIPPNAENKILELNAKCVPFTATDTAAKTIEVINLCNFVPNFIASLGKRRLEEDEIPLKRLALRAREMEEDDEVLEKTI